MGLSWKSNICQILDYINYYIFRYYAVVIYIFFSVGRSLNSGLHVYKAGVLLLEPHLCPFCSGYFGDGVS
jgi:hypothetical protein